MTSIIDADPDKLIQWLQLEGRLNPLLLSRCAWQSNQLEVKIPPKLMWAVGKEDSIAMSGKANEH